VNDEAKKRNEKLPGQGGVFNYVNLHAYHYAGNNPVKYVDPDGREPQSYKWSDGTYHFYAGKSTLDGAVSSVFRDVFPIPFVGGIAENIINARFGFRNIETGSSRKVHEELTDASINLTTIVSDASFIVDIANITSNAFSAVGNIATGFNWTLAALNARKELNKQDSVGLDIIIERVFGNELTASSHEGVAALYLYTRSRMEKLKEDGAFSYTTNRDGSIKSFVGLKKSVEDELRQDIRTIKASMGE